MYTSNWHNCCMSITSIKREIFNFAKSNSVWHTHYDTIVNSEHWYQYVRLCICRNIYIYINSSKYYCCYCEFGRKTSHKWIVRTWNLWCTQVCNIDLVVWGSIVTIKQEEPGYKGMHRMQQRGNGHWSLENSEEGCSRDGKVEERS